MLKEFAKNVLSISRHMLQSFFIRILHMLQQYIPNVSVVLVLCYYKWFYVAASGFMLQVASAFILDVSYVSHKCCKSMFPNVSSVCSLMLLSCCKCFMLFSQGRARAGDRASGEPRGWGRWTGVLQVWARCGHTRQLLIPAPVCHPRGA
jgi:hypothetical protein